MRSSKGWGDPLKRRWLLVLAIIVLLTVSILYGTVFSRSAGVEPQKYENIGIVIEVVSLVRGRYYQPVSTVDLLRSYVARNINGMLSETLVILTLVIWINELTKEWLVRQLEHLVELGS